MNNLGRIIKELREVHKLTQLQLSKKSEISREYIAQLESGEKKNPSPEIIEKLAKCFNINSSLILLMSLNLQDINDNIKSEEELLSNTQDLKNSIENICFLLLRKKIELTQNNKNIEPSFSSKSKKQNDNKNSILRNP